MYLLRLGLLFLREELVHDGALLKISDPVSSASSTPNIYLESAADTEHTVVGLLGWKTLESLGDNFVLLGDQVIGPADISQLNWFQQSFESIFASESDGIAIAFDAASANCTYLKPIFR
jgi:hypothetical protein